MTLPRLPDTLRPRIPRPVHVAFFIVAAMLFSLGMGYNVATLDLAPVGPGWGTANIVAGALLFAISILARSEPP